MTASRWAVAHSPLAVRSAGCAPPERDQWFDPWKIAKGDNLRALVESTGTSVQRHEGKPRPALGRGERRTTGHVGRIEAVVCNLAHAVLLPPPTRHRHEETRSRHDSPLLEKGFEARLPTGWGVAKTKETILSVHAPLKRSGVAGTATGPCW